MLLTSSSTVVSHGTIDLDLAVYHDFKVGQPYSQNGVKPLPSMEIRSPGEAPTVVGSIGQVVGAEW